MEQEIIEGDALINVIMKIPRSAVQLKMEVSILEDGKVKKAITTFDNEAIREMRQAFLDNVEEGDEFDMMYCLTEEGKKYLDGLE
jgi:hypothetical protein